MSFKFLSLIITLLISNVCQLHYIIYVIHTISLFLLKIILHKQDYKFFSSQEKKTTELQQSHSTIAKKNICLYLLFLVNFLNKRITI